MTVDTVSMSTVIWPVLVLAALALNQYLLASVMISMILGLSGLSLRCGKHV